MKTKTITLTAIVLLTTLLTSCVDDRPMSNDGKGWERVVQQGSNPLYDYNALDTKNINANVYEFNPKTDKDYFCVIIGVGNDKILQCMFKIKETN